MTYKFTVIERGKGYAVLRHKAYPGQEEFAADMIIRKNVESLEVGMTVLVERGPDRYHVHSSVRIG